MSYLSGIGRFRLPTWRIPLNRADCRRDISTAQPPGRTSDALLREVQQGLTTTRAGLREVDGPGLQ
jgi:hypothetical protein